MRALVATPGTGARVALRDVPEPEPGPGRPVVAVRAVSLNRGEVRALDTAADGAVLGWDVAGEVLAPATDGRGPAAGARVVGLVPAGGWAEQVAVPVGSLAELPDSVDLGVASTLPVAGLTAYVAMQLGGTAGDERVLVTGAAGGVGHIAVQLAAHRGAAVTAVVGRPERAGDLERLGATTVSVGMPEDGEFDLILEAVGGATLGAALGMVAPGGHVVSYGCASGEPTTFDVRTFYGRCGRLTGFQLGAELARAGRDAAARDLDALARMLAAGQLEVCVGLDVGWEEADTACRALLDRRVPGKAVLRIT